MAKRVVEGREEGPYTRLHASQAYVFPAVDGDSVLIHMSSPSKFWEGLCAAVERPGLLTDPRFEEPDVGVMPQIRPPVHAAHHTGAEGSS